MGRPPHDPADPKGVDETTDAWDTVDWLIKNIPNNNGRAGIAGTSYDGWTAVMAALDPHPALKAAIEQASPADQFLGDDFHHNGAFRLSYGFEYSAMLETIHRELPASSSTVATPTTGISASARSPTPTRSIFTANSHVGGLRPPSELRPVLAAPGFRSLSERREDPDCARGRLVGPGGLLRPAEDLREAGAARRQPLNYFVAGPWNHGRWNGDGRRLGAIDFGSDTSQYYREHIFQPWFDYWLRGQADPHLAEATTFETGANQWRQFDAWPPRNGIETRRLYFREGRRLSFDAPTGPDGAFDEYISDPANPVPYRPRPVATDLPWPRVACVAGAGPALRGSPPRRALLADRTAGGGCAHRREHSARPVRVHIGHR